MSAIHEHRPVLVRREQQVLAEHPLLRVFPGGGEAGELGEVAFTVLVVPPGARARVDEQGNYELEL